MYSVLIVDDERFMREGIAKILPWAQLNVGRVDTADSGMTALKKMEEHMPDLVITDIEMQHIDGLSLIQQMNQCNPEMRIIVLTGHDDFAYVQQCCRMEVQDYLLKPVDEEKLAEAVDKQIQEIGRKRTEQVKKQVIDRVHGYRELVFREQIFREYLASGKRTQEIHQALAEAGYLPGEELLVALLTTEGNPGEEWEDKKELLDFSVKSACVERVETGRDGLVFQDQEGALVFLLFEGEEHCQPKVLMDEIWKLLQDEYDLAISIYYGESLASFLEIKKSYQLLRMQWKQDTDDVVSLAKKYIKEHLGENLSVTELAAQYYLSVAYFSKLFKKTVGVGCNYYIFEKRMEKAKQLLSGKKQRVSQVAGEIGYNDVNYFSLSFKKYTGLSPAEYQEQQLNNTEDTKK